MVSLAFSITPDDYAKFYTYMMGMARRMPPNAGGITRQLILPLIFLAF